LIKLLNKLFVKKNIINNETDIIHSKHFCILPWIHTHLLPSGDVLPCCVSDFNDPYANVNKTTLQKAWNSSKYKIMRKLMLLDRPVYSCNKCYELEESGIETMRKRMNQSFKHHAPILSKTKQDGSYDQLKMKYLDIRFSNICNFKCRGCSPALSTKWYEDHQKLWNFTSSHPKLINVVASNPNLWMEIEEQLDELEVAYFAGGEPLIMDEHYQCLEYFIKNNKTDIALQYNTNLSVLQFKKYNLVEMWKHFKKVNLSISLDDIQARGEYFRSGFNWETFLLNIEKIKNELPHISLQINCTISIFNIHRIPEIHSFLYGKKYINEFGFIFNTLQDPSEYRSQVLTPKLKTLTKLKLESYAKSLNESYPNTDWGFFKNSLNHQIQFMMQTNMDFRLNDFKKQTNRLDEIRSENFKNTYPELVSLLQS